MHQFDRELQNKIINLAAGCFPKPVGLAYGKDGIPAEYKIIADSDHDKVFANCIYLKEHGLITLDPAYIGRPDKAFIWGIRATVSGVDFIRDDGGVGAILKLQTVKFHRDTIIALEDLIALSDLSDTEKHNAKSRLRELSLESLKSLVQTVTAAGLKALLP